jgi:hypothetical protein
MAKFSFNTKQKNTFGIISAINMLRVNLFSKTSIKDKDVVNLFAYSKMTIIDEMRGRDAYFHLEFVEFLEFICRVSHHIYRGDKQFAKPEDGLSPLVT